MNIKELKTARANGKRPEAPNADLRGTNLREADLYDANLRGVNLHGVNLRGTDLREADLYEANLRGAYLYGVNLRGTDLRGTDLRGADLREADLHGANLRGANLHGANLHLQPEIFQMCGIKSGEAIYFPTPTGWHLLVGCWSGTLDGLRELISTNEGWPEAEGDECDDRRIDLEMLIRLCQRHADRWPDLIPELAEKWGTDPEDETRNDDD